MKSPYLCCRALSFNQAIFRKALSYKFYILLAFCCLSLTVSSQIYTVNSADDTNDGKCNAAHCSLREAIHEVNLTTGSIEFDIPGSGPFIISPSFPLPKLYNDNIIIDATTQPNWSVGEIVIHGSLLKNCLQISGSQVEIYGLKIEQCTEAAILLDTINNVQSNITIGKFGKANMLTSNAYGIVSTTDQSFDITIQSNIIGTDENNKPNLGNLHGIIITGSQTSNIKIGGSVSMGDGNRIVGSINDAVIVSSGVEIYGNVIGDFIANQKSGIRLTGSGNLIGGGLPQLKNEIVNNGEYGIIIDNSGAIENTVSYNSFYCNGLGAFDNNGNNGISPPVITDNSNGTLGGTAGPNDIIEIYKNESFCLDCQPEELMGFATADGTGKWAFNFGFNVTTAITASATDSNGNTSSFSNCFKSDDCVDAVQVPVGDELCASASTIFNTEFATVSADILYDCSAFAPNGAIDVWVKAVVPATGAVMLKMDELISTIDPMVEVYTGDCSSLQFEKCDSLFRAPYQFPVAELTPGDFVYFRVFDQNNLNQGYIGLNIIELPADTADWKICSDSNEFRASNDFVVQYEDGTTPAEVQAATTDLLSQGLSLVGECECNPRPLQLWRGSTPVEAETGGLIARNKAEVDTVNYNFIIEDQLCVTENLLTSIVYFPGSPGQPGGPSVVIEPVFSYDDCTPTGLFEPLGPAYIPTVSNPSVNMAIIDTGFDENNLTVQEAVWKNPEVTDSDNCYLDDDSGYDFLNDDGSPNDIVGHGSAVAGIIAGGFNQNVDLGMMNLKFSDSERSTLFPAICGIYYAIDNGAQVMNLSWGFITTESIPGILLDALNYAFERDVLIVTSAGNSDDDIDSMQKYPANHEKNNIISVGAYTQESGSVPKRASYSNYGVSNVDLFANGQVETIGLGNTTHVLSGTSLSAPQVSKTGSEIRAKYPALSAQDVRECILSTVDVYPDLGFYSATGGVLNHDAALFCAYQKALAFCGEMTVSYDDMHSIDTLIVKEISILSTGIVSIPRDVIYKAGNNVLLNSEFEVEKGATFLATIEDCSTSVPIP